MSNWDARENNPDVQICFDVSANMVSHISYLCSGIFCLVWVKLILQMTSMFIIPL